VPRQKIYSGEKGESRKRECLEEFRIFQGKKCTGRFSSLLRRGTELKGFGSDTNGKS